MLPALPPTEPFGRKWMSRMWKCSCLSLLGLSMSRFRIFGLECLANNFNLFIYSCDKFQFRRSKCVLICSFLDVPVSWAHWFWGLASFCFVGYLIVWNLMRGELTWASLCANVYIQNCHWFIFSLQITWQHHDYKSWCTLLISLINIALLF
jgi:hypothetical protein